MPCFLKDQIGNNQIMDYTSIPAARELAATASQYPANNWVIEGRASRPYLETLDVSSKRDKLRQFVQMVLRRAGITKGLPAHNRMTWKDITILSTHDLGQNNPLRPLTMLSTARSAFSAPLRNDQVKLVRPVPSYEESEGRILNFCHLTKGWDSEEALPPNKVAIGHALSALKFLNQRDLLPWRINPSRDESITFEIQRDEQSIFAEFYNSGEVVFLSEDAANPEARRGWEVTTEEEIARVVAEL